MIGPRAAPRVAAPVQVCVALAALGVALVPRPSAALDLAQVLRQVSSANPALIARERMVDAARRREAAAGTWPSPMLELGVANVPTDGRFDEDPMTMKMLGVSQSVPVSGANGLARRSARAAVSAARAAGEQARFETLGAAWEAYCDAYYAGELVRLVSRHRSLAAQAVESARARYQNGQGRLEDVLRSQAGQGMFEVDLAQFRADALGARARLDALRGETPGSRADSLAAPPDTALGGGAEAWLAAIGPSHPRLGERSSDAERYRLAASAMRRRLWPDLELRYAYGWREALHGTHVQDDMFSASVGLALPIFGPARADAAEMDAMARASEQERQAVDLELRAQVTAAHAAATSARWRSTMLADTVIMIQKSAVEASWATYRAGGSDLWRVLESTHALYEDEVAVLRARKDFAHAAARLVALTGRTDLLGVPMPAGGQR